MVRLLVPDFVRRNRLMYVWLAAPLGLSWAGIATGHIGVWLGLMLSLFVVNIVGPMAALTSVGPREIRVLPVTHRDLWITSWTLSTVVAVSFATAVAAIGVAATRALAGSIAISPLTLVLVAVYAFALGGIVLVLGPFVGIAAHWVNDRKPRWLWVSVLIVALMAFIGAGLVAPYLLAETLPTSVDRFTPITAALLAGCIAVGIAPVVWTPNRGGAIGGHAVSQRPRSSEPARARFGDRFTGVSRILWTHASSTVVVGAIGLGGFMAYAAVFEPGANSRPELTAAAIQLAAVALLLQNTWAPWARQLRVLPITVREINLLFLATPVVTWAFAGTTLAIVLGWPGDAMPLPFTAAAVFAYGAFTALGQAFTFRFQGHPWFFFLIVGLSSPVSRAVASLSAVPLDLALVMAGAVALALAAFVNHRTLTRSPSSSIAYQRMRPPFGIGSSALPR